MTSSSPLIRASNSLIFSPVPSMISWFVVQLGIILSLTLSEAAPRALACGARKAGSTSDAGHSILRAGNGAHAAGENAFIDALALPAPIAASSEARGKG